MSTLSDPSLWGNSEAMTNVLVNIKSVFDSPTGDLPKNSIAKVLQTYRQTETLESFLELKYACFGVGQDLDGWRLLDDEILFSKLLDSVDTLREQPRRLLKCYQGLLSGYFAYPLHFGEDKNGRQNFERLRDYLKQWLSVIKTIERKTAPMPAWLATLIDHDNLLDEKSCDRYVEQLLKGEASELQKTFQAMGITRESWVWEEALLAQVNITCAWDDARFRESVEPILVTVQANDETMISERLAVHCVSALVVRYVQCISKPEHATLRNVADKRIGNPWLKRAAWDAYVKKEDGTPYEEARAMISEWLDRRGAGRLTNNEDGTLTDNKTGVVWLSDVHGLGRQSWPEAMEEVQTLSHGQCGLMDHSKPGDWRLPTKSELSDLIVGLSRSAFSYLSGTGQRKEDYPDAPYASSSPTNYYWAVTNLAGSSSYRWALGLCDDHKIGFYDQSSSFYAWPVRTKHRTGNHLRNLS